MVKKTKYPKYQISILMIFLIIQISLFQYLLMSQVLKGKQKKELLCQNFKNILEGVIQNEFLLWLNSNKKISKTLN